MLGGSSPVHPGCDPRREHSRKIRFLCLFDLAVEGLSASDADEEGLEVVTVEVGPAEDDALIHFVDFDELEQDEGFEVFDLLGALLFGRRGGERGGRVDVIGRHVLGMRGSGEEGASNA